MQQDRGRHIESQVHSTYKYVECFSSQQGGFLTANPLTETEVAA